MVRALCEVLDGGVSTSLRIRGESVEAPWWSSRSLLGAKGRERLLGVHHEHVSAGATVVTANTFRCNRRTLGQVDLDPGSGHAWMVHAAVGVAQRAAGDAKVAGSVGPVEDAYRPDLVPSDEELRDEHRWLLTELARSGVHVALIETMNTAREAVIATDLAREVGLTPWTTFVCNSNGQLLSGEPVADAAALVSAAGAEVVGVNCTDVSSTGHALDLIREVYEGPLIARPNVEDREATPLSNGAFPEAVSPPEFATAIRGIHEAVELFGAGACCGGTKGHVASVAEAFT